MLSISEIIAIIAMTFGIGYIFSDFFKKPLPEGYDPISYYSVRRSSVWENTKFAAMIAAPPVVLHELAHKIVAMAFGAIATIKAPYLMYAIVILLKAVGFPIIFFVGGYVSHTVLPAFPSAMVAVAGPLTNFIIWGVCVLLVKNRLVNRKYYKVLVPMGRISLFLGIFNMIPFPGFDGYHFFRNIISVF